MRIALLSWESLHSIAVGGVASHVTELAAALQRSGHEAHVFTRRTPSQRYHDCIDGVHYHRCNYPGNVDFVEDVNNMCRAFVDRFYEVEDFVGHFDIVHAHDWLAANAMVWIKQGRGHRCVMTVHSTEYARCGNAFPAGRSHRVRVQERAGTYWADRVIAVSQATKNEIMWMYEVPDWKAAVVNNGVSPHRFDIHSDPGQDKQRYQIGPMDPTILFCGRLAYQKGPDLLLEAVPLVLRTQPRAKFVLCGDGEMRSGLEARARQMGVMQTLRFVGFRDGEELVRLFKLCDVVCVPSRNEPFGIVVLEAWSASKPVVVTQNGGPNEYVEHEHNGLKIHPHPESVAWGVGTTFANFDRARWMGANGRRTVEERFTWNLIAEQTLAVYDTQRVPGTMVSMPRAVTESPGRAEAQGPPKAEPAAPQDQPAKPPVLVTAELRIRSKDPTIPSKDSKTPVLKVLRELGLDVQSNNGTARVQGELDSVLKGVRLCYELLDHNGAAQITASLKMLEQHPAEPPAEPQQHAPEHAQTMPTSTVIPLTRLLPAPTAQVVAANERTSDLTGASALAEALPVGSLGALSDDSPPPRSEARFDPAPSSGPKSRPRRLRRAQRAKPILPELALSQHMTLSAVEGVDDGGR